MMSKIQITLMCCIFFTGCATVSSGGYYWGKYSYTYHDLLKAPSTEAREAHEATLRDIIEISEEKDIRVPPSIHAELAYLLTMKNENEEAQIHYEFERTLYPESQTFLERLLSTP